MDMSQSVAKRILENLHSGVPTLGYASLLNVGRATELQRLKGAMREVQGGSPKVLLIRGDWGGGKSHLLMLFQEHALGSGFLVSHVELSTRETSLHQLPVVYRRIVQRLRSGVEQAWSALPELLAKCVQSLRQRAGRIVNHRCKHGLTYGTCAYSCLAERLTTELIPELKKQDWCLTTALQLVVWGTLKCDDETVSLAHRWLAGESLTYAERKAACSRAGLDAVLDRSIGKRDLMSVLSHLSTWARLAGYAGIAVFFDEAESIPYLSHYKSVVTAYVNFARILDTTQKSGHTMFVYSTTPTFYEDIDANFLLFLRQREELRDFADFLESNLTSATVSLSPLSYQELLTLAEKISEVVLGAQGGEVTEAMWQALRPKAEELGRTIQAQPGWTPRQFVTDWTSLLEAHLLPE